MQLGELLEKVYREIHDDIVDGVATSGSSTTIGDTAIANKYTENKFKNWIAFISRTTDGAAPQGQYSKITTFVTSTGLATTTDTLTAVVGAGDDYAFCKGTIPLFTLIKLCNDGIRALGRVHISDASLTTAADTLRYTLPAAVKGIRPRRIEIRDSTNYEQFEVPNWRIEPTAGETAETLVFKSQPVESEQIVVYYMGVHPALTAYTSAVNGHIDERLAVLACTERALGWKVGLKGKKVDKDNWGLAKAMLTEAKQLYPIERPIIENKRLPISIYNDTWC